MKATLPRPEHASYLRHRRQFRAQILLPLILGILIFLAAIVWIILAAGKGANVAQWGAVASIWIVLPLMVGLLIFTLLLAGLVYLMARLLGILPVYSGKAQDFFYRLESLIRKFTNSLVKPVFGIQEVGATLKALIGRR